MSFFDDFHLKQSLSSFKRHQNPLWGVTNPFGAGDISQSFPYLASGNNAISSSVGMLGFFSRFDCAQTRGGIVTNDGSNPLQSNEMYLASIKHFMHCNYRPQSTNISSLLRCFDEKQRTHLVFAADSLRSARFKIPLVLQILLQVLWALCCTVGPCSDMVDGSQTFHLLQYYVTVTVQYSFPNVPNGEAQRRSNGDRSAVTPRPHSWGGFSILSKKYSEKM
jgi:hypothetical protein